jgi:Tfp pilus assembly protein PilZ
MKSKEKRSYIRIPMIEEYLIVSNQRYKIEDISESGVFILECLDSIKANEIISLQFILPGDLGYLNLNGKVARINWTDVKKRKKGAGIELYFNQNTSKIYKSFVTYLRNKQIITVSKRIIEEMNFKEYKND